MIGVLSFNLKEIVVIEDVKVVDGNGLVDVGAGATQEMKDCYNVL